MTAQILTQDTSFHWSLTASSSLLSSFSSEPGVSCFSRAFVQEEKETSISTEICENMYEEVMGSLLYECASHEKLDLLSFWISAFQLQWQINRPGHCFVGAQLALIKKMSKLEQRLICSEIVVSIIQSLKSMLDQQKKCKKSNALVHDIVTNEANETVLINSLFVFENLGHLPLDTNVNKKANPLKAMRKMSGHASHSLAEFV